VNTNKTISNNNNSKNNAYPAYEDRHGNVQQPRTQKMQRPAAMKRPQPMQRPKPLDVYAALLEKEAQERRKIVRSLPPMHEVVGVGSAGPEEVCVVGRTGMKITVASVGWLEQERRHDSADILPPRVPVEGVMPVEAPVATPVAKPAYRKDSGKTKRKAKRKVRVMEVDAPWLDPKEASMAYRESIAWSNRIDAAWTAKKKAMVKAKMVRSMADPTPEAFMSGLGLTFEAEHELLRRRHVAEDAGDFLILSREAGALSPWGGGMNALAREAMRLLIEEFAAELSLREAAEEAVRGARREMRAERERIECGAYSAPAERPETPDAELKVERAEAAMESDYARHCRGWKPSLRPGRISSSGAGSKPVHKGGSKAVSRQDAGVVVDPYMVVAVAEKRQAADLIGPKVVARRVR